MESADRMTCLSCGNDVVVLSFKSTKAREPVEMYDPDRWGTREDGTLWRIPGFGWYVRRFDE